MLNDFLREEREESIMFVFLKSIVEKCDIIIFYVFLYKEGKYKMYYLVDKYFFYLLKKGVVIMNILCGEVIEIEVLFEVFWFGILFDVVIDVWEYELDIDFELLEKVIIGIFYIVGYLVDGKVNVI